MDPFTNFSLQHPYLQIPYQQGPPTFDNTNPWISGGMGFPQNTYNPASAPPLIAQAPLLPNQYPPPQTQTTPNSTRAPDRPSNAQVVPKKLYESVLAEKKRYVDQIEHLRKNNQDLKNQIFKLEGGSLKSNKKNNQELLKTNKKIERLELQITQARDDAAWARENTRRRQVEYNQEKMKNETLIRSKNEMRSKINDLEQEVNQLKSNVRAEQIEKQRLSGKISTLNGTVKRLKATLECQLSDHKEELKSQQEEFNQKLEDCSQAVDNEIKQYKELLKKMNKQKKKNIEIQQQLNKITTENTKLLAELKTDKEKMNKMTTENTKLLVELKIEKEKVKKISKENETILEELQTEQEKPHECECSQEAQDLWKLVRELQESNRSPSQPTSKRKKGDRK